jgi:hypothetical protein
MTYKEHVSNISRVKGAGKENQKERPDRKQPCGGNEEHVETSWVSS